MSVHPADAGAAALNKVVQTYDTLVGERTGKPYRTPRKPSSMGPFRRLLTEAKQRGEDPSQLLAASFRLYDVNQCLRRFSRSFPPASVAASPKALARVASIEPDVMPFRNEQARLSQAAYTLRTIRCAYDCDADDAVEVAMMTGELDVLWLADSTVKGPGYQEDELAALRKRWRHDPNFRTAYKAAKLAARVEHLR